VARSVKHSNSELTKNRNIKRLYLSLAYLYHSRYFAPMIAISPIDTPNIRKLKYMINDHLKIFGKIV